MKTQGMLHPFVLVVIVSALGAWAADDGIIACSRQQARDAANITEAALSPAQLACVFASNEIDARLLATTCKIVQGLDKLLPVLRELIGQREGARRAGVRWSYEPDSGTRTADAGL